MPGKRRERDQTLREDPGAAIAGQFDFTHERGIPWSL